MHSCFDSIHVKQYEIATCIIDLWGCTEISPNVRSGAAHCFNLEKNLNTCVVEYNTFSDISENCIGFISVSSNYFPYPNYIE